MNSGTLALRGPIDGAFAAKSVTLVLANTAVVTLRAALQSRPVFHRELEPGFAAAPAVGLNDHVVPHRLRL